MSWLDPEHRHPVSVIPAGQFSLLGEADLAEGGGRRFDLQQVEHDALEPGKVVGRMVLAHGGGVLAEVHVQHPMDAIFDAPVRAHRGREGFRGEHARADVVATLGRRILVADLAQRLDHAQHATARPAFWIDLARVGRDPEALPDEAPVGLFRALGVAPSLLQRFPLGEAEPLLQGALQARLVALHGQQVVGLLLQDLRRDLALTAHRVKADEAALDQQRVEQFGDGPDLVALAIDLLLPQHETVLGGIRAHQVDRPARSVARAAHRLAIDRKRAAAHRRDDPAHPASERFFERARIEDAKHAVEGIVGRDAAVELQEALEPAHLVLGPDRHVFEAVHVAQRRVDGDRQDLLQVMPTRIARSARVLDLGKATHQGHRRWRFHSRRPKDESRRLFREVHKVPLQVLECERLSWVMNASRICEAVNVN